MSDKMTSHFDHLILDSIPIAIVAMDTDFKITYMNNPAEDLTGYSASEALGKHCPEILDNKKSNPVCPMQTLGESVETTTGIEGELNNRYGEHIPVRLSIASIKNDSGVHIGYLEIIEDISREKALEREKNNFHFMLAHDMKSPLVAILGLINKIREHHEDMPAEKVEHYCKTIKDSGEQLEAQVIEFLEYSRQTTGKIKLNLEKVNLSELIDQLILRYQQLAGEKNSLSEQSMTPYDR